MHVVCPGCLSVNRLPRERLLEGPRCGRCNEPALPDRPLDLHVASFDRFLARSELPLVVDFWATWCGPCKMMAPVFARAAREHAGRLVFGKVETDAEADLAGRFAIRSIPTLILFRDGVERARITGALDSNALGRWLLANA
jgi:thioredoxin 2